MADTGKYMRTNGGGSERELGRARILQALGRCIRTGNNVSAMSGGGSERELAVRRE